MSDESKVKDIIEATKGVVEAVPIYQDAIQPAAKELGKTLAFPIRTINALLKPIGKLVWKWEQIWEYTEVSLSEKLSQVPEENLITPSPTIAGPTFEALRFLGNEVDLRELYIKLLASSMDSRIAHEAHPAFVEIIKQMTSDEARIMKAFLISYVYPIINLRMNFRNGKGGITVIRHFSHIGIIAEIQYNELTANYLDNLCRLGLLNIPEGKYLTADEIYTSLDEDITITEAKRQIEDREDSFSDIEHLFIELTDLGKQFINACIKAE